MFACQADLSVIVLIRLLLCYTCLIDTVYVLYFQPDFSKLSLTADSMWKQFLNNMVPEITKVVQFCKKLPGN